MISEMDKIIKRHDQQQVMRFFDELDDDSRNKLTTQIEALPWDRLDQLINEYVINRPVVELPEDLAPAPYFPLKPADGRMKAYYEEAIQKAEEILRAGKVSLLTVAGGQGTRLGYDGPKGTYPITPIRHKPLFQYFAEKICRFSEKYQVKFTWYIMTSELNDQPTRKFFQENKFFGMDEDRVVFFVQGTMPAFGMDGKLLLGAKDSLALSPDGHGGTLLALKRSGCLERMRKEGVEYLSYFQVDNPLVSIVNPLFIGLHALEEAEMSAIMLAKTGPFEKLGNFCIADGKLQIIEYSDLPDALAESRNPDGSLRFIAGSPAIHIISREFVEKLTEKGYLNLPWHRADKKVPYVNDQGELVTPEEINGVKLEQFIFDALPLARKTMILEADREEEFAPTKNKTGVDSVESCKAMQVERDARRLERAGIKITRNAENIAEPIIELSPRVIADDADAAEYCRINNITDLTGRKEAIYLE